MKRTPREIVINIDREGRASIELADVHDLGYYIGNANAADGRRRGAACTNTDRTTNRTIRDGLIRVAADADTGDPRGLVKRLAARRWPSLSSEKDANGKRIEETVTEATIRNSLRRTAVEKRKRA